MNAFFDNKPLYCDRVRTALLLSSVFLFTVLSARSQNAAPVPLRAAPPVVPAAVTEQAMKITAPFTLAAGGDFIDRQIPGFTQFDESRLQNLIKVLRDADVSFANLESPIMESVTAGDAESGGMPKTALGDLKAMGIGMVSLANNHALNRGVAGLFTTIHLLDEAGIAHAGAGKDLQEARAVSYLSTPKGVVGTVGIFSIDDVSVYSLLGYTAASPSMGGRAGTPGVNGLHLTTYYIVTADQLQQLRKIRDSIYHRVGPVPANEPTDRLEVFGRRYKVGPNPGGLSYTMDPKDLREILQSIRDGKAKADFMIATIHCHQDSFTFPVEWLPGQDDPRLRFDPVVPDFLVDLAHQAIDNGADAFIGHGVHFLRGVEIYKGKPIFYGLGSFVATDGPTMVGDKVRFYAGVEAKEQNKSWEGDVRHPPTDLEALVVTCRYEGGRLVEVRLYPTDSGQDQSRPFSRMGIPMAPSPEMARRVLEELQTISKPFGTKISIEDNIGVIRISPEAQQSRK